jgi:hypothetical protein
MLEIFSKVIINQLFIIFFQLKFNWVDSWHLILKFSIDLYYSFFLAFVRMKLYFIDNLRNYDKKI